MALTLLCESESGGDDERPNFTREYAYPSSSSSSPPLDAEELLALVDELLSSVDALLAFVHEPSTHVVEPWASVVPEACVVETSEAGDEELFAPPAVELWGPVVPEACVVEPSAAGDELFTPVGEVSASAFAASASVA